MSVDIQNTCRICMVSGTKTDLVTIFEDTSLYGLSGITIAEKLKAICILVPTENDPLPQLICHTCVNELDQAYQFKEKASNSETVLHSILSRPGLEKVDVKIEPDLSLTNGETTAHPTDLPLLSEYMIKIEEGCELEVAALEVLKEKVSSKTTVEKMDQMLNVKFPCMLCNQEFATKKYLNRHIKRHLAGRLKASRKERLLEKHYNIPVLEKHPCKTPSEAVPFKFHHRIGCPFCGMMFANQGVYDKHYKIYHLPANIEISKEAASSTPVAVNDLIAGVFTCHYDGRKFGIKKQLRRHMNRFHRLTKRLKKKHKCRRLNCEEMFATLDELERHRRDHDVQLAQQVYTCDLCSKALKTLHSLKQHMEYVHNPSKNFLCNECGKGFVTKSGLKAHLLIHMPYKQFSCDICGRAFSTKGSLTKHIDTHKGLQPYRCEYPGCTAKYTSPATLTRHNRKHTGETPYQCEFCLKRFRVRTHMVVHRRIHTNERPYKCTFAGCDKAFNQRGDMLLHTRVHTGVKPHICPICQMAFRQPSTLKTHIKGVHKHHTPPTVVS